MSDATAVPWHEWLGAAVAVGGVGCGLLGWWLKGLRAEWKRQQMETEWVTLDTGDERWVRRHEVFDKQTGRPLYMSAHECRLHHEELHKSMAREFAHSRELFETKLDMILRMLGTVQRKPKRLDDPPTPLPGGGDDDEQ